MSLDISVRESSHYKMRVRTDLPTYKDLPNTLLLHLSHHFIDPQHHLSLKELK